MRHLAVGKWLRVTSWALQLWAVPPGLPSPRMQEWSLAVKGQFPQHSLWRAVWTVRICCTSREQWCHLYPFSDSDAFQLDWYRLAMVNLPRITHFHAKPACSFWMHFCVCFCTCFVSIVHNSLWVQQHKLFPLPASLFIVVFFFFNQFKKSFQLSTRRRHLFCELAQLCQSPKVKTSTTLSWLIRYALRSKEITPD